MPSAPFIQANTNGRLHRADEPGISPLNRGYLYGDAVYEVWRTYAGVIFAWEEHWARLERSAAALHFDLPFAPDHMLHEIARTATAFRRELNYTGELYIRLQVARGAGAIGLDTALADDAEFVILVQPCPRLTEEQLEAGQWLSIATGLRRNPAEALNPAWKTGNYLNNLLCLREARSRGADEVVILNQSGEITEAAVCNLGFLRDGELVTPPLSAGILGGITRALLLREIAPRIGMQVREESVLPGQLAGMQEAFLMATTKDLQPVRGIDSVRYAVGSATLSRKLKSGFADFALSHAEQWRSERAV